MKNNLFHLMNFEDFLYILIIILIIYYPDFGNIETKLSILSLKNNFIISRV